MKDKKIFGSAGKAIVFLFFCLYALSIIGPMFWMIISSLKGSNEYYISPWALPEVSLWGNYAYAIKNGVAKYFFNSVLVTSATIVLTVFISALASFILSKFEFKLKNVVFYFIIGGMMISPEVNLVSLFKLLQTLHIYNTYWAMIIPYCVFQFSFTVLLMRSYMLSLPKAVDESAFIDGCTTFKVFFRIVLPMSRPVIASAALFSAMQAWNEFMFAMVFVEDNGIKTIPVGLMVLKTALTTNYPVIIAALVISASVMVILFLFFQKQFVRGLTQGGVKG